MDDILADVGPVEETDVDSVEEWLEDFIENTVADENLELEEQPNDEWKRYWKFKKKGDSIALDGESIYFREFLYRNKMKEGLSSHQLEPENTVTKEMKEYDPVYHGTMSVRARETIDITEIKEFIKEEREKILKKLQKENDFKYVEYESRTYTLKARIKEDIEWDKEYGFDELDEFVNDVMDYKEGQLELEEAKKRMDEYEERLKSKMKETPEYKEFTKKKKEIENNLFDIYQETKEQIILNKLKEKDRKDFKNDYLVIKEEEPLFTEEDNRLISPTIHEEKDKVVFYRARGECDGLEWRQGWFRTVDMCLKENAMLVRTEFRQYFFNDPKKSVDRNFLIKVIDEKPVVTQVPSTITNTKKAIEYTKNYELKKLEEDEREIIEFGDYYFAKMKQRHMQPNDINDNDDKYECTKDNDTLQVTHPYYGIIEFEDTKYKPIKKKTAQRKEKLTINNFSLDHEKYSPDVSEEKKQLIEEREEELLHIAEWDTMDEFLEPVANEDHVVFLEPLNYNAPSQMGIRWIDREDADEDFLLVTAGEKIFWHGSVWGIQNRTFLLGKDESGAWFHQVPTTIDTVEDALEYMKPAEVKKAEEKGLKVKRLGDIYFIERVRKSNMDVIEDTDHKAEETENGWIIRHPEHDKLELEGKWKAIQNNTASRPGLRGRRLAD